MKEEKERGRDVRKEKEREKGKGGGEVDSYGKEGGQEEEEK